MPTEPAHPTLGGLAGALRLAGLGLRVFPVRAPVWKGGVPACSCKKGAGCRSPGKHPRITGWQSAATTDPATIADWWGRWPDASIGVATGRASRLFVLDIDPGGEASLAGLIDACGPLPETVEAITGRGGRHLLLRQPGGHVKTCSGAWPGIDVRGDGGFVVAPPSLHVNGRPYEWRVGHAPGDLPIANLPGTWIVRLVEAGVVTEEAEKAEDTEDTEDTEERSSDSSAISASSASSVTPSPTPLDALFRRNLPSAPGQRRRKVFDLVRHVRFRPEFIGLDAPPPELRPKFDEWHRRAFPFTSRTKSSDDTWDDACRAWHDARHPPGQDIAADAFARTAGGPVPARAKELYTDPRRWHLAAACREMQLEVGSDRPFLLSCHQAGKHLGVEPKLASRWLNTFVRDGLLEEVEKGKPGPPGSRASRWRWTGSSE